MAHKNYTASLTVDQTPLEVFNAINNVRGWWSENIIGDTNSLGGEFTLRYQDIHHCTIKVTEFIPGKKVTWHIVDNYFNFVKDKAEWTDTDIVFEITEKDNKTELRFTHVGLIPHYECYEVCSDAWSFHINHSLYDLIATGKGQPNPAENMEENK